MPACRWPHLGHLADDDEAQPEEVLIAIWVLLHPLLAHPLLKRLSARDTAVKRGE